MNRMTLEDKRLQTRLFDTTDQRRILSASKQILQDLGFKLVESEMNLGLIVGSQDRDVIKAVHLRFAEILASLNSTPATHSEKMRISVVSSPAGENAKRTSVRVTFERIVWDNYGRISKRERLYVPELYQGFFKKLSKAVSLKAHQESQAERHTVQSRIFDTTDKSKTSRAIMAALQDLGFVINKADGFLGSVSATKFDHYAVRMNVNVRNHGETQIRVHANAQHNLKTIDDPELYEQFFAALEEAMF